MSGFGSDVALVTGANSGIGRAIARALAEQGRDVVVHYLAQPPVAAGYERLHEVPGRAAAEEVAAEVRAVGARAALVEQDLAQPGAAEALVERAEQALGPVGVLVNNAAHCEAPDTVLELTEGALARAFRVNAVVPGLLSAEVARRLVARGAGGAIVNVSTDAARAFSGQIAYGASKAALEAMTRSMAIDLGPHGITVNAVAPGPVQTGWITPELEQQVLDTIPLRRLGRPRDVADAVAFLAGERARWISGQVVQVAGGHALL